MNRQNKTVTLPAELDRRIEKWERFHEQRLANEIALWLDRVDQVSPHDPDLVAALHAFVEDLAQVRNCPDTMDRAQKTIHILLRLGDELGLPAPLFHETVHVLEEGHCDLERGIWPFYSKRPTGPKRPPARKRQRHAQAFAAAALQLELESLSGHSAPLREAARTVAAILSKRVGARFDPKTLIIWRKKIRGCTEGYESEQQYYSNIIAVITSRSNWQETWDVVDHILRAPRYMLPNPPASYRR